MPTIALLALHLTPLILMLALDTGSLPGLRVEGGTGHGSSSQYGLIGRSLVYFIDWLKNGSTIKGRASWTRYWSVVYWRVGLILTIGAIEFTLIGFAPISSSFLLVTLIPGWMLGIRRVHDHGLSGCFFGSPG